MKKVYKYVLMIPVHKFATHEVEHEEYWTKSDAISRASKIRLDESYNSSIFNKCSEVFEQRNNPVLVRRLAPTIFAHVVDKPNNNNIKFENADREVKSVFVVDY